MALVTLMGMSCSGHGCFPPRGSAQGEPLFAINGTPVHLQGHAWGAHTCPAIPETHSGTLSAGIAKFTVNGKQVGSVGDPVSCGSSVAQGFPLFDVVSG